MTTVNTIRLQQHQAKFIAHRGLSGIECQNTCSAFVAAGNRSYWGIESDVHKTADGVFVMIHDNDTRYVCDTILNVEQSTYKELAALQLNSVDGSHSRKDLKIPTLEEYIQICATYGKVAVLETKTPLSNEDLRQIVTLIDDWGYLQHTVFISFDWNHLVYLRSVLPDHPMQFLTEQCDSNRLEALVQHRLGLDIAYPGLTDKAIAYMHQNDLPVNCWTCCDPDVAYSLIGRGVDYITTDILE